MPGGGQEIRVMRRTGHPGHVADRASVSCGSQGIWVMPRTGRLGHATGRASGSLMDEALLPCGG